MNAASKDIVSILNTDGIGTEGTDLFYSSAPESPDDHLLVTDIPGPPVEELMDGTEMRRNSVQIQSRNNTFDGAITKIEAALANLKGKGQVTIAGSARYIAFWQDSTVFDLDEDKSGRFTRSVYVRTIRQGV